MIYTLKVSQPDLVLIGSALGRCAYDDVKGLIAALQRQITEQEVTEQEEAAKDEAAREARQGEG